MTIEVLPAPVAPTKAMVWPCFTSNEMSFNAQNSLVAGGDSNVASSRAGTIGGGEDNTASGSFSTIGGGINNTIIYLKAPQPSVSCLPVLSTLRHSVIIIHRVYNNHLTHSFI